MCRFAEDMSLQTHCISGNEAADELTKPAAAATVKPPRPISFVTAKAITRRKVTDQPSNRPRTAMVYETSGLWVQVRLKSPLSMHRLLERRWDVEVIKVSKNEVT